MTGARGCVGAATCTHLSERGHEVVGVGRHPASPPGVYGRLDGNLADPAVAERLRERIETCEAIVHAAACLDTSPDAAAVALTNCLGTQQVLALATAWQSPAVAYVSSIGVVGAPRELPVTEDHTLDPATAYHASKLFGERLVALFNRDAGAGASLRITSPAGPGMSRARVLCAFTAAALAGEPLSVTTSGSRRQDFVDVRDVAAALTACVERRAQGVINVGAGAAVSNQELAQRTVRALDSASPVEMADPAGDGETEDARWEISIERAAVRLGYRPVHALEDTIRSVAASLV